MNPIDDDTLQAYVDGELDATKAAQIDAALVHDDLLRRRVQQARALRAQLKAAFDPVLDEAVPARLSAQLRPAPAQASRLATPLARSAGRRGFGTGRRGASRRWWKPVAAATASVAVLAVTLWWHAGGTLLHDDRQYATAPLSDALDRALASEPDPRAAVSIGLSFRSTDGHICRTFIERAKPTMAGLACHDDEGWRLSVLTAAKQPEDGELRQAASGMPPAVQTAVDARIRGEAFDARQERAARDADWR